MTYQKDETIRFVLSKRVEKWELLDGSPYDKELSSTVDIYAGGERVCGCDTLQEAIDYFDRWKGEA